VGSPENIPLQSIPQRTEPYRSAAGLRRESLDPVVQGYKNTAAVGARLNYSDPLELNRASITASITPTSIPSDERVHLSALYERYDWRGRFEWNRADFYDLFGPTKTSRKGYLAAVGHQSTLIFDEPRRLALDLDGSFSGNLDRLPEYQNVVVDVRHLATGTAHLVYEDVRNSQGAVDDETGLRWSADTRVDDADGSVYRKWYATADHGWAVGAAHSSVWIRGAGGLASGSRSDPFANFYFGGFGNNWVDAGNEKRYREYASFPGLAIDGLPGRNFVKSLVEWNLPPVRLRHAGIPGFYATWIRPAIFVGGLATNLDAPEARQSAADVGGQIDFRFSLLSALDMTVSVGGAVAYRHDSGPRREATLSVKVLR
ncbi:MAG: hypothetical protein ACRD1V_13630, partial [Vicinamibacterales bacterium]